MFERKDNKKEALLDLDGRLTNLNKRYTAVKEAGIKIQAMVAVRPRDSRAGVPIATVPRSVRSLCSAIPETCREVADPQRGFKAGSLTLCHPPVLPE